MRLIAFFAAIAVLFALADPSTAQVRYSGVADPRAQTPSAQAAGLRLLTWPGKVTPAAGRAPALRPQADYRPLGYAPARYTPLQPAFPAPARPAAAPMAAAPSAALPTSIYAAPPATPAPVAPIRALALAAPTSGDPPASVRFYSLHRPYGDTPDPVPLTPQFFSDASPDLAQPPPPVARPATTATGRVLRPTPADPDTSAGAGTGDSAGT